MAAVGNPAAIAYALEYSIILSPKKFIDNGHICYSTESAV
jgi:hypothetical protein